MSDRLLTTRKVAEILGVMPETVLRWIDTRGLPAIRLTSRALRYDEDELAAWLAERATATPGREARTVPTGAAAETVPSSARTVPLRPAARDEED